MTFDIPLEDGRIVHMYCDFSYPSKYYDFVWVDAQKFRKIWGDKENHQDETQWKAWKYYPEAERAFSNSKQYPVPLAKAGTPFDPKDNKMHFVDGTTRTTWLLINGAKSFPIACSPEDVPIFKSLAGAE